MSTGPGEAGAPAQTFVFAWRAVLSDDEVVQLCNGDGASTDRGWWERVRGHSLGWVSARDPRERLIGFVNVAWDGARHAFLLDTVVAPEHRRCGVATRVVALAVEHARHAGCEWLHVDFEPRLSSFYLRACGFRPTDAGLIPLR